MKIALGKIADITMGQSPKSDYYNNHGEGLPFLQGNRTFGDLYPSFDTYTTAPIKIAEVGDVIMSVRAPVGDLNITPVKMCLGRGVCSIRSKNGNQPYLFYLMKHSVKDLISRESGTVFGSVNSKDISSLEVEYIESEDKQRTIASFLGSIDARIEINKQINHNLQQQAKAIFDEWFIKIPQSTQDTLKITPLGYFPDSFSVVKTGELPIVVADYVANGSFASLKENVKLYQSKNYAYFIRNTDLKSGSFEVFVDKHSYDFLSKSRLFGGEIIISNVGDVGSVFLCPTLDAPMTLGNNIIMIKSDIPELRLFLYIWFKWSLGQGLIQGIKSGSAQPKFNKTDFKNLPIILPPSELLQKFNSTVSPIFEMIERNDNENRKLSSLRDSILPKLMSGEIDVSEVEV